MTKNIKTDVLYVTLGNFLAGAVMVLIFALLGQFSLGVVLGALLGCSFASLSFLWLAAIVSKNIEKDPENAKKRISATYTCRLLATALIVVLAIKLPYINWLAAIIPLFYQRIIITWVGKGRFKKEVDEN